MNTGTWKKRLRGALITIMVLACLKHDNRQTPSEKSLIADWIRMALCDPSKSRCLGFVLSEPVPYNVANALGWGQALQRSGEFGVTL